MAFRIAISGVLGSGKSTVCKELQRIHSLSYFSTGAMQRKIAAEMGMSTYDLNRYAEGHPEIDRLIDGELIALSSSTDNIVIDSRMAWHFVKGAFKVYLTADETVAALRVIGDKRGSSETYSDISDAKVTLRARKESENFRYNQKYGVECNDFRNYDLIVDTTQITPEATAKHIMSQFEKWEKEESYPVFWISPKCLHPTNSTKESSVQKYLEMISSGQEINPVKIVFSDGLFYIYDGHNRTAAYEKSGCPLVPCSLLDLEIIK